MSYLHAEWPAVDQPSTGEFLSFVGAGIAMGAIDGYFRRRSNRFDVELRDQDGNVVPAWRVSILAFPPIHMPGYAISDELEQAAREMGFEGSPPYLVVSRATAPPVAR